MTSRIYRRHTDYRPHTDADLRPAQIYAQAMAASHVQMLGYLAAAMSRLTGARRRRG